MRTLTLSGDDVFTYIRFVAGVRPGRSFDAGKMLILPFSTPTKPRVEFTLTAATEAEERAWVAAFLDFKAHEVTRAEGDDSV